MDDKKIDLHEQIKILIELQVLDSEIMKLDRELNETIPDEIKAIDDAYAAKASSLKKLEEELKAMLLKRKEKELDLETKEGAIRKKQSQLFQVKTNKEYAALEQEIASARADNSLIEEEIIVILDQIDAHNRKISAEKEVLKSEEGKAQAEKRVKQDKAKALGEELARYRAQRAEVAGKIDSKILARYERLLSNRDGMALVPIRGDACQGCFQVLPPQVINEVRMKKALVLCENCSRILYVED